jgi:hypothetical protein
MTRQTSDVLSNGGHEYSILEVEGGDLYRPPETVSMSTACAKGFNCKYKVLTENGDLLLTDLVMRTENKIYPALHGVSPTHHGFSFVPEEEVDRTNSYCLGVYEGLNLLMSHFTGRIMLGGAAVIQEILWDHSDATAHHHVLEIHVERGRVTRAIDLSEQVAARRRRNSEQTNADNYHPFSWSHDLFLRHTAEVAAGTAPTDLYAHEDDL